MIFGKDERVCHELTVFTLFPEESKEKSDGTINGCLYSVSINAESKEKK
jgi:hypothetical protein